MPAVIRTESQHEIPFPRSKVWPVLSKTDWINRSIGLPPVTYDIQPQPFGGTAVTAKARLLGLELRWQERPFEWLEEEYYQVHRVFETGPLSEARLGMDFLAGSNGGTKVRVYSELSPRNAFGAGLARFVLGPKASRDMTMVIQHVREFLEGQKTVSLPKLPVTPAAEQPLQTGLEKLRQTGQPEELMRRLEGLLRESPDVEICRMRPLAIARAWQKDSWEILRLFLQATRCGLLDLSWEVLCPYCRSTRQPLTRSLAEICRTMHCEACQIRFDAEFDKSVELKFAVNPAIRPCAMETFCLAGPGGKPHIVSQLLLAPNQRRPWKLPPLSRAHRLRSPQVKQPVTLTPEDAPRLRSSPVIVCRPDCFEEVVEHQGGGNELAVQVLNPNSYPVQLILERIEWSEDILTAARVTNWQEFRDLFASEVVSPREQITVGQQIVLFTDLRGSTAMYCGIGDAPAYALVRDHFFILQEAIRKHHGTIVKTIGDAVMAVFSLAGDALAAVREMHQSLAAAMPRSEAKPRLLLKSSLHIGPCLAVNANEKLDFFGTTINLAARMVGCCQGGDLTVSDELFQRPETARFILGLPHPPESSEVEFRGFESPHKVWRLQMV
ncbi:MAG: adenylate/guanylate cyclase domain-containing protein [Chloroflexi bacterium]|nr:adenylate/guanylate cyclase domain-containing protein [Chloroflexota bacterium]